MGNYQITNLRYQPTSWNLDEANNVRKKRDYHDFKDTRIFAANVKCKKPCNKEKWDQVRPPTLNLESKGIVGAKLDRDGKKSIL